jgi:hypothetical protein
MEEKAAHARVSPARGQRPAGHSRLFYSRDDAGEARPLSVRSSNSLKDRKESKDRKEEKERGRNGEGRRMVMLRYSKASGTKERTTQILQEYHSG